jgi:protein-S-isoprenylcysteine O-methyltransferase Ste14
MIAVTALRHLLAILLLPFVMVVLVPRWLLRAWSYSDTHWPPGISETLGRLAGMLLVLSGFALFAWCVSLFARIGKGTLAPWDPTQRLVAVGPYQYLRNPMISGVLTMLIGEAVFHGSQVLAIWAATFFVFNHIYFLAIEEPGLESRFGDDYRRYKSAVPRWIPRLVPWKNV